MLNCPICKSNATFKFVSKLRKNVYQCESIKCSHLFVDDYLSSSGICDRGEEIEEIRKQWQKRIDTYRIRNINLYKKIFEKLNLTENAKVLDFGSGDGYAMYHLRSFYPKVDITCIEPNKLTIQFINKAANKVVDSIDQLNEKYDLIFMNEVIEHLDSPIQHLQALSKLLKDENSAMYIATPLGEADNESYETSAYNDISHLHFFTRKSLNLSLIQSGFTPLDVNDINDPLYYFSTNSSIKFKLKKIIFNIIKNKLLNVFYVLPKTHISGLAYKNQM